VVDDYEPFRQFICSTLRKRPELQIVGEVSDGLEAVHKVEELQADLILLDIGLPTLNGIEAARQIRKLAPESKIIFVSQESSADVVQEALALGALGYVVKAHAGSELLAAVGAVLTGSQFVGSGLLGHICADATDAQARNHELQFYSDESAFLVGFTSFIEATLKAENAVIVVATEPHQISLLERLRAGGGKIIAAVEQKRYIPLNVADTLSTFMVHGSIDPIQFARVAGDLIEEAADAARKEHHHVALC
jgi:DNA-binding NarL/FixJ family response regulator